MVSNGLDHSISIVVVTWNSYDWLQLLLESLDIFTANPYEVIVVDNSDIIKPLTGVKHIISGNNIGHGEGLNIGVKHCTHPHIMFFDVDCHVLCHGWDQLFLDLNKDVVGGKGVPAKPIRPACMFLKSSMSHYDWRATPGYRGHRVTPEGHDVAISAYHQMVARGVDIELLPSVKSRYGTISGEEFCIGDKPVCYHHWSGTYLDKRQADFPNDDLFQDKENLFTQIPWRIP